MRKGSKGGRRTVGRKTLILNLYYVEELTLREIAYILDISTRVSDPWENPNKLKDLLAKN